MIGSLQTGISGLDQFQQDLEVIGNNIANVNTTGFKSARMDFQDTFSQSLLKSIPSQIGTGVATGGIDTMFTQGTINGTGVATDLAIQGPGFFVVKNTSTGQNFVTRDGTFQVDANGYLVTNQQYRVQGYSGAGPYTSASPVGDLQITAGSAITALGDTTVPAPTLAQFSIDSAGQINATLSDNKAGVIGQVVLQNFAAPQHLIKDGGNLYTFDATAGSLGTGAPSTSGMGTIQAQALESSNVDLAAEMAALITAQRAFEANAKVITTSDEVLQAVNNLKH